MPRGGECATPHRCVSRFHRDFTLKYHPCVAAQHLGTPCRFDTARVRVLRTPARVLYHGTPVAQEDQRHYDERRQATLALHRRGSGYVFRADGSRPTPPPPPPTAARSPITPTPAFHEMPTDPWAWVACPNGRSYLLRTGHVATDGENEHYHAVIPRNVPVEHGTLVHTTLPPEMTFIVSTQPPDTAAPPPEVPPPPSRPLTRQIGAFI